MQMFTETYGLTVQPEDFLPFVGAGEDRYLGGVAEKHGLKLTMPRDKDRTYQIYLEIIKGRLKPLPGVREFIAECRRRGLKLAVATSADQIKMIGNLKEIGLPRETFDTLVNGSEVAHKKPHPEIFATAAARLHLPAERCLVIEDAPNGIRAGKAAGCKCLGLSTTFPAEELTKAGADWTAPDLSGTEHLIQTGRNGAARIN